MYSSTTAICTRQQARGSKAQHNTARCALSRLTETHDGWLTEGGHSLWPAMHNYGVKHRCAAPRPSCSPTCSRSGTRYAPRNDSRPGTSCASDRIFMSRSICCRISCTTHQHSTVSLQLGLYATMLLVLIARAECFDCWTCMGVCWPGCVTPVMPPQVACVPTLFVTLTRLTATNFLSCLW